MTADQPALPLDDARPTSTPRRLRRWPNVVEWRLVDGHVTGWTYDPHRKLCP